MKKIIKISLLIVILMTSTNLLNSQTIIDKGITIDLGIEHEDVQVGRPDIEMFYDLIIDKIIKKSKKIQEIYTQELFDAEEKENPNGLLVSVYINTKDKNNFSITFNWEEKGFIYLDINGPNYKSGFGIYDNEVFCDYGAGINMKIKEPWVFSNGLFFHKNDPPSYSMQGSYTELKLITYTIDILYSSGILSLNEIAYIIAKIEYNKQYLEDLNKTYDYEKDQYKYWI